MRSTFFKIFNTYINIISKEIDVEDKSLEKSLKRANSGGTHQLLKTKFLNSIEGKLFSPSGKVAASGLHTAILVKTSQIEQNK